MIGSNLSLIIELIVSLLLVVTISYCFIVNRKLTALRADQSGLRQVIGELNRSAERAERAIAQMRQTAQAVDGEIAGHIGAAQSARDELMDAVERSADVRLAAEKLTEVDLKALQLVSKVANPAPVSPEQLHMAKQLKRQRLGFKQPPLARAQAHERHTSSELKALKG